MAPPAPSSKPRAPARNQATPYSLQAYALEKLLHDPLKPVSIPAPPPAGVKVLRAPRDQMKNVQGSSAGAGSGEFHVYKESRRREYERIQLMEEEDRIVSRLLSPFHPLPARIERENRSKRKLILSNYNRTRQRPLHNYER